LRISATCNTTLRLHRLIHLIRMTTIRRAGPLCDNAPSMGNISLIVRLTRGSHPREAVRKSRRKPSCSSELQSVNAVFVNLKLNLARVLLDAYSRRHEAQKIYLRQAAAQRWVDWRDQVLQGQAPQAGHGQQLAACDAQLRVVSRTSSPRSQRHRTASVQLRVLI
jgi:hypothetical protein